MFITIAAAEDITAVNASNYQLQLGKIIPLNMKKRF